MSFRGTVGACTEKWMFHPELVGAMYVLYFLLCVCNNILIQDPQPSCFHPFSPIPPKLQWLPVTTKTQKSKLPNLLAWHLKLKIHQIYLEFPDSKHLFSAFSTPDHRFKSLFLSLFLRLNSDPTSSRKLSQVSLAKGPLSHLNARAILSTSFVSVLHFILHFNYWGGYCWFSPLNLWRSLRNLSYSFLYPQHL